MEAFLSATALVAIAEIGDKTQLLALLLAARFRAPLTIIAGILAATLANHAAAAWAGSTVAMLVDAQWFTYAVAAGFFAMALWVLIPDSPDAPARLDRYGGPFMATLVLFFLAEIGDKTQIATIALAAQHQDVLLVTLGTTLGMLLANVPAVLLGHKAVDHLPLTAIRIASALLFAATGAWMLWRIA